MLVMGSKHMSIVKCCAAGPSTIHKVANREAN